MRALYKQWADSFAGGKIVLAAVGGASYFLIWAPFIACVLFAHILLHEFGHATAARRFGLRCTGIYVYPFLGGHCYYAPRACEDVRIAISAEGPVWGMLLAAVCGVLALLSGSSQFSAAAALCAAHEMLGLLPRKNTDAKHMLMAVPRAKHLGLTYVNVALHGSMLAVFAFVASWIVQLFDAGLEGAYAQLRAALSSPAIWFTERLGLLLNNLFF